MSEMKKFEDFLESLYLRLDNVARFSMVKIIEKETVLMHVSRMQALALYLYQDIEKTYPGVIDIKDVVYRCLIHDSSEIFTGDIPYPVKHATPEMEEAYKTVEEKLAKENFPEWYWLDSIKAKSEENENAYLVDLLDSLQCITKLYTEYKIQNTQDIKDRLIWSYKVLLDKCQKYSKKSKIADWYTKLFGVLGSKWLELR